MVFDDLIINLKGFLYLGIIEFVIFLWDLFFIDFGVVVREGIIGVVFDVKEKKSFVSSFNFFVLGGGKGKKGKNEKGRVFGNRNL